MFRDRDKALEDLQAQLLQEDDGVSAEEPQECDDPSQDIPDVDAYNTDTADTDLEAYSEAVYTPRRSGGCVLWFVLLTAAVVLVLALLLAIKGGLI